MTGTSALEEGGLFIYAHLLACIIPSCRVQACLLDAPGLLSLSFYVLSYFKVFILSFFFLIILNCLEGGRKSPQNTQNCCRSFPLEAELFPKVQRGEHLCPGVHESWWPKH